MLMSRPPMDIYFEFSLLDLPRRGTIRSRRLAMPSIHRSEILNIPYLQYDLTFPARPFTASYFVFNPPKLEIFRRKNENH